MSMWLKGWSYGVREKKKKEGTERGKRGKGGKE